jgi:SPFH domain / Band 7 family
VIIPFIDVLHRVSLRIITMPVQSQGIITRDNVSVDVSAVAYFRVVDAVKSVVAIENVRAAIDQIAQTTLRKVVGHLQSLVEIGVDKNTTVVFPAPLMTTIAELGSFLAREQAAASPPPLAAAGPIPPPLAAAGPIPPPLAAAGPISPPAATANGTAMS